MRAITIKQPWASLICDGAKDVENRTWKTNFRGRILIHAGLNNKLDLTALTKDQYEFASEKYHELGTTPTIPVGDYLKGAIIGSVEIVDCVINHPSIWAEKATPLMELHNRHIYNWVLSSPVKFSKPIPCKGKLSLWDYPITEEEYLNLEKIGLLK